MMLSGRVGILDVIDRHIDENGLSRGSSGVGYGNEQEPVENVAATARRGVLAAQLQEHAPLVGVIVVLPEHIKNDAIIVLVGDGDSQIRGKVLPVPFQ
jgi:hypothetical protein